MTFGFRVVIAFRLIVAVLLAARHLRVFAALVLVSFRLHRARVGRLAAATLRRNNVIRSCVRERRDRQRKKREDDERRNSSLSHDYFSVI